MDWYVGTNVSEEHATTFFRLVNGIRRHQFTHLFFAWAIGTDA